MDIVGVAVTFALEFAVTVQSEPTFVIEVDRLAEDLMVPVPDIVHFSNVLPAGSEFAGALIVHEPPALTSPPPVPPETVTL